MSAKKIEAATIEYLNAFTVRRDARRMIDAGFNAATERCRTALLFEEEDRISLFEAEALVVAKEAVDLLGLYEKAPLEYPEGRTADLALAASRKNAGTRYRSGKCRSCGGRALPCACRRALGKSCA